MSAGKSGVATFYQDVQCGNVEKDCLPAKDSFEEVLERSAAGFFDVDADNDFFAGGHKGWV